MNATDHKEYDFTDLRRIYRAAVAIVGDRRRIHHGIIFSSKRSTHVVKARRIALCAVLRATECSYASLGKATGMDHTTVMLADRDMGATDEVMEIAGQLDVTRGGIGESEPFWMQMARANGWHGPGACLPSEDMHGGEL